MSYYPLIEKFDRTLSRVVTLQFPTGDVVKFTSTRHVNPNTKVVSFNIKDNRSFRNMRSSVNDDSNVVECRSELDRMLTVDDASNAFDFLTQSEKKEAPAAKLGNE